MKVKKFTAPTMPEAMKTVRRELGQTAVILDSREKKSKGLLGMFQKKQIEVIAATDPNPVQKRNKGSELSQDQYKVDKRHQPSEPFRKNEEDLLAEIRRLSERVDSVKKDNSFLPAPILNIQQQLLNQEIKQNLVDEIVNDLLQQYYSSEEMLNEEDLMESVKKYLSNQMNDSFSSMQIGDSKHVYLFGPTGVGKTTTLAKLAATASINEGKRVAFITLDTYRIAAIEQLKTYAKILNVPIEVAYNQEDLKAAKEKFKDFDMVLVDSAGRNYHKKEYIDQVKELIDFTDDDQLFCVLSLTSKEKDLQQIYQKFSDLPINKVIFTKADETSQFGSIYNLWSEYSFEISYITHGQNVPDDFKKATSDLVVDMLVGEHKW
ncbi:flagellar biosynthesis protein FlhF [Halalkalibacillus sediminis]|uniref:Flagellar biosynthesis protein FlhF n=1 Tax=Halalkalibacillus sediminis TaxID=2018042 RepID=A0A2I0QWE9_9BACI|nr:flagellar biosynthesis protein FlhF [Halalkalibacillus sediminis]PKR78638.1 flagellar biosynthesis protein FlhF [Halalkalibacillus sediminis]